MGEIGCPGPVMDFREELDPHVFEFKAGIRPKRPGGCQVTNTVLFLSSGLRPRYKYDVIRALALPRSGQLTHLCSGPMK
jgi:hypothetical protein